MIRRMELVRETKAAPLEINGDTPTMRLFSLLEVIASKDQHLSLQDLVEETALPKPTLHRMLQQLEGAGLLQRAGDGRSAVGGGLRAHGGLLAGRCELQDSVRVVPKSGTPGDYR